MIALAVEADDEHRSSVTIADRLIRRQHRSISAFGRGIANALAETTVAELVGTAKELDGIVGVVRSQYGFHGAVMLVAKGQDVRPHAKRV